MKIILNIVVFIYFFTTNPAQSQTLLTDSTNDIFGKGLEFSGLAVADNKYYLLSEKCKKIFVRLNNQYYDTISLNLDSLPFQNSELEGFCFFQNQILFACDERNAKVVVINVARNTVKEVPTDLDLSEWTGNTGMEGIAVDKTRNKLFLLREKDNQRHSEIRVFNIVISNNNFSLEVTDTIMISHSADKWRYTDLSYDPGKQQLLLVRSYFEGECSNANKYIIDTIKVNKILTNQNAKSRKHSFNSERLVYKDVSSTINSYCENYSTNIEGISFDRNNIYLISDNEQINVPKCNELSRKPALFIKVPTSVFTNEKNKIQSKNIHFE